MDAVCQIPVKSHALAALSAYLRDSGSTLSLCDAATLAVRAWLAAENDRDLAAAGCTLAPLPEFSEFSEPPEPPGPAGPPRTRKATGQLRAGGGYQWKELFLPDGTELRMQSDGEVHRARVTGDAIVHQGRRLSPRQFTLAIAGDGRNAWRDLSLRLPGEIHFRPAAVHRHNARAQMRADAEGNAGGAGRPSRADRRESPAETIAAAAQAMSEALRTALALVEHSNAQALPQYERRVNFHRRASDVIADHVKFD